MVRVEARAVRGGNRLAVVARCSPHRQVGERTRGSGGRAIPDARADGSEPDRCEERTAWLDCHESSDPLDCPDSTEPMLWNDRVDPSDIAEPVENAEANELMLPIESTEPTLAMDRIDPSDAIDRMESRERMDHLDPSIMLPSCPSRVRYAGPTVGAPH